MTRVRLCSGRSLSHWERESLEFELGGVTCRVSSSGKDPCILHRSQLHGMMWDLPSVCYGYVLLSLVNKETVSTSCLAE